MVFNAGSVVVETSSVSLDVVGSDPDDVEDEPILS